MTHLGLLCPPTPGHLNPMSTLGRELRARGHRVTMFQLPELKARVEQQGLEFWPIGGEATGELAAALDQLGRITGLAALRFTIGCAARLAKVVMDHAPDAIRAANVELMIVDQNDPASASVAEHLGLPFISVASALPINREPNIPPPFVDWPYLDSSYARLRNRVGYAMADLLLRPVTSTLNRRREQWGLSRLSSPNDSFSRNAQICTLPKSLDFPRRETPESFHYVGPFIDSHRPAVDFPWERLNGRRLIYASFGTLQNRRQEQFLAVAQACAGLDVQLILSAGGGEILADELPGSPLVVRYAPQVDLLARASLAITHAGLNTVLESVYCGVPMVAIPVTNDQPAVAARLQHAGVGAVVPLNKLSANTLRAAIENVLNGDIYREKVEVLKAEAHAAGGVKRAADIVEQHCSPSSRAHRLAQALH